MPTAVTIAVQNTQNVYKVTSSQSFNTFHIIEHSQRSILAGLDASLHSINWR